MVIAGPTASGKSDLAVELSVSASGRDRQCGLHAGLPAYGRGHGKAFSCRSGGVCLITFLTLLILTKHSMQPFTELLPCPLSGISFREGRRLFCRRWARGCTSRRCWADFSNARPRIRPSGKSCVIKRKSRGLRVLALQAGGTGSCLCHEDQCSRQS